jgi:outer membrane protein TolC
MKAASLFSLCLPLLWVSGVSNACAEALSWSEAVQRVQQGSDQLAGARAAVAQRQAHAEGIANAGGPIVSLYGAAYSYKASLDINLDPLKQGLGNVISLLPPALAGALPPLPPIPSNTTLTHSNSSQAALVNAVWPIYLGGATDALRGFAAAQSAEALAELSHTEEEALALLAQRYFQTQMARRAASLREAAAAGVAEHDAAAEKMLSAGVASKLERLQARAALQDAQHQARKARSDAELVAVALARTVKLDGLPTPSTPLSLSSEPLPPLQDFIKTALTLHPGLAKVAAKRAQAEQLKAGSKALERPQVFAFGQRSLTHNGDWLAGVGVRMNLWDSLDHNALNRAHLSQLAQVDAADAQARSDITLLVERQWRSAEQARSQYISLAAQDELGLELLRLRRVGLQQGTSTTLDLIDAELNLAKLRTERAQIAYEHVMALVGLLQASGQLESLADYLARADVRIE